MAKVKAGATGGGRKGYRKVLVSLRPDQVAALGAAAHQRADQAGRLRSDASEIVREALDAWFGKRK